MHAILNPLLWLALALPVLAGAADPLTTRLQLVAVPGALRLADGDRATIRIDGASEPPVMAASVGRVESIREVSSGVYAADYVPPESLDPQIAFVTAVSGGRLGWVSIALSGVRDLTVSARRGTPVSVSVETEVFGPVPADAMGRAVVRVAVPPGVRTARYGNQALDLRVSERSLVHLVLSSATADANTSAELEVLAFATTERGKPRANAPLVLAVSEGVVTQGVQVEPGVFEARWKVERSQVGQAQITARLQDRPASVAIATLERMPGPPARIAIELDRDRLVAGEGDELGVTARVLDAAGNATESATTLLVDSGAVLEWERTGRGRHEGRVQVPRWRAGRQQLEVKVVASRTLAATRLVTLVPGVARRLHVEAEAGLFADGRTHPLRLSVLDGDGNRVDGEGTPVVQVARGQVTQPVRYAPGAYRLDYRAPLAGDDYEEVIRARLGPLSDDVKLRVRARSAGIAIAPKVGVTLGTGQLRSPTGGAEVGFWTDNLGPSLGLVLEAQVYAHQRHDTLQGQDLKTDVTFLSLAASLAWRRPVVGWLLWLGAGGGAVSRMCRVTGIEGQAAVTGNAWAPTAQASLGLGRPIGPGAPFAEVKAAWQGDATGGLVRGSLRTLTLQVGYRFDVL